MGLYINVGNEAFRKSRNREYVDKSGLIAVVNSTLNTRFQFTCVSRCRRFGKSMAAEMLAAYYDQSCDSRELFADLEIANDPSFEKHLNKYPVIYLDMTDFVSRFRDGDVIVEMQATLMKDISTAYPDIPKEENDDLMELLMRIASITGERFIFIIDEWDAICREFPSASPMMRRYVDWLRRMFKSVQANTVFAGVYMTGILPVKKYKTQSALNNFQEYSMVEPGNMARFFGFTKEEVRVLAERHSMDFDELVKWYDGYKIGDEPSMFNPNSVMQALNRGRCRSFWANTGAFDTVADYIKMNFDGLKDSIIDMLGGGNAKVNTTKFQNDMSIVNSKDDVLTVLIHLGYLSYNWVKDECFVPNREVAGELTNAVEKNGWTNVALALQQSERLLQDTLNGNAEAVAAAIEAAHDENTSILSYNDENSMACVLSIAYYYAHNDYVFHRELASGKGFADLVLVPRKNVNSPAIIIELKYNDTTETALDQIRRKNYPAKIQQYLGNATAADNSTTQGTNIGNQSPASILLVGIAYDKASKTHTCQIESA